MELPFFFLPHDHLTLVIIRSRIACNLINE